MINYSILQDKVFLITGGSRGIGFEIARCFAEVGARVIISGRNEVSLVHAAKQLSTISKSQTEYYVADMAVEQDIISLSEKIHNDFGQLDGLINNAGITHSGSIADTSTEDWDKVMAINARGTFLMCRECLDLLRNGELRLIINISSVVGVKGYALQSAYTASKHAVRGFSIALAEELKPEGFRVHVVCPGGVDTDMVGQVRPDINKDQLIQAGEIADAILFLAASKSGRGVIDEIRIRRETSGIWF